MKLVMYGEPYQERPGVIVEDDFILDLELAEREAPHSIEEMLTFDELEQIEDLLGNVQPEIALIPLSSMRLGPPLAGVGKVIAVGLNYHDHAEEMELPLPDHPLIFAKASSSIAGPYDDLALPPASWSTEIDYEIELGVVISHQCHQVSVEDAPAYIAGYTIVNDITARDIQRAEGQWFRAKSFDGFCPVGPYLVTPDEIDDPQSLALSLRVNDELRQFSNTDRMIFSIAEIISFVSHSMTLQPGDLIATGTPAGIGGSRKPPVYLQPGDVVELEIEQLGSHRYTVVR